MIGKLGLLNIYQSSFASSRQARRNPHVYAANPGLPTRHAFNGVLGANFTKHFSNVIQIR